MIESVSPVITLEMILAAKACPEQVALFNHRYPIGFAVVTPENVLAAIVDGINIYWAGKKLLRGEFKRSYKVAIAEALKVFNTAMDEPHKVYAAALVQADKLYDAALAEPHKVYAAALAQAFSNAFNAQFRAEVVA
jgi:hypothetical protein